MVDRHIEIKRRVTGGDDVVIHVAIPATNMASSTYFSPLDQRARIGHTKIPPSCVR